MANHKLVVIFDSFASEDEARWYAQHLKHTDEHVAKTLLVEDEDD